MKFIYAVLICLLSLSISAQGLWFDAGLKVQYGGASLLSKAVSDSPDWNYDIGNALSYGGKIGINFENSGITIDIMRNTLKSKFERAVDASNVETTFSSLDLYVLYRLSRYRGYIELGPKVSFINDGSYNDLTTGDEFDVADAFNSNAMSAVLGFGTYVLGNDGRFSGIFGLRFEYGFTDALDEPNAVLTDAPVFTSNIYGDGYQKAAPLFAGLVFELNWGIGYYGKASCGQRGKFIFL